MHLDDKRILARVDRAQRERIAPAIHADRGPLTVSAWQVPGDGEPVPAEQAARADFAPVQLPVAWGRAWSTWWFRLEGEVPALVGSEGADHEGEARVRTNGPAGSDGAGSRPVDDRLEIEVDLGFVDDWPGNQCEGLLHDAAMTPLKAINSRNRRWRVQAAPGTPLRLFLEAAANPDMLSGGTEPTRRGDRLTVGPETVYALRTARFVQRRQQVWDLWHDVDVLRGLAGELPADSTRRAEILCGLDDMLDVLDLHDVPGTAAAARAVLAPLLAAPAAASAQQITTIGHAHIDSAWLWPVRETIRKVARTFSNVDVLMDDYPELTFTATSAQQYQWLAQTQPAVHERVAARIREGRWFPSGGMWVESDANLPSGESLIRQFTYGTRFFEENYGVRSRTLWLPDSFGYAASLPQIARLAGHQAFLTQKISWSKTNRYPHTTFWWEGIDGTRLLTHYPPVDCYDSMLTADEIATAERNHRDKGRSRRQVMPFGYGDGGGGPTPDMAERARRRADLDGSARLSMGDPDGFFDALREEYGTQAPTQRGELYLEFHRGVYTSQLEMKQGNRRAEHALRTLELVGAMLTARGLGGLDQERVDRLWERTLLLQFHDILPGTSIAWVHREARDDHARILADCAALTAEGLARLAGDGTAGGQAVPGGQETPAGASPSAGIPSAAEPPLVLNPTTHRRLGVLETADGPQLVDVPGSSLTAPEPMTPGADGAPGPVRATADGERITLENGLVAATIEADGTLSSVHDLVADRELVAAGARANVLQMFEDVPNEFDAWDVDRHYRGSPRRDAVGAPTVLRLGEHGPVRAVVTVERRLGESPATQTFTLAAGSRMLEMSLEVDWMERETLLKAAFPLAVQATETLAEIPCGHLARPLHENTSWEFAKFELPAHRWLLAAEPGCGVALIADSTYGYDALPWRGAESTAGAGGGAAAAGAGSAAVGASTVGTLLRPSLMRSPNWPDPEADLSRRTLRYGLLVGADPVAAGRAAEELNMPLLPVDPAGAAAAQSESLRSAAAQPDPGRTALVPADPGRTVAAHADPATLVTVPDGMLLDAILPAHDGSGDLIVRLHEATGGRSSGTIRFGVPVSSVEVVDVLDEPLTDPELQPLSCTPAPAPSAGVDVVLRPFQILSLRLTLPETP